MKITINSESIKQMSELRRVVANSSLYVDGQSALNESRITLLGSAASRSLDFLVGEGVLNLE